MHPDLFGELVKAEESPAARVRVNDSRARALGVTEHQLMESAGRALAEQVLTFSPVRVLVLCGNGNNGGDGMVAARYLQRGVDTAVCYLDLGKRSIACGHNLAALRHAAVSLHPFQNRDDLEALADLFGSADVIVDALLGTGGRGAVKEPLATCIRMANTAKAKIIAADIPTPGMRADRVCAFHRAKTEGAMVVDIGIPLEAECTVGPGELTLLPARGKKSHKGAGGEVLVIGGGPYQGAPYLAGLGALRAGADIVRIASPAFEHIPDLIYERLDGKKIGAEHIERLISLAEKADVVVWCVVNANAAMDAPAKVLLAGWSTMDEISKAPIQFTGLDNMRKVENYQLAESDLHEMGGLYEWNGQTRKTG
jgi:NAD(P)H-hydrate epimerase